MVYDTQQIWYVAWCVAIIYIILKGSLLKLYFTPVLALTRSLEKLSYNSLTLLKMVVYLSQEKTKVLMRSVLSVRDRAGCAA